jgi:hypothetical protein
MKNKNEQIFFILFNGIANERIRKHFFEYFLIIFVKFSRRQMSINHSLTGKKIS